MDKLKKYNMPSGLVAVFFLFCIVAFSGLQASLVNAEPVPVIDKTVENAILAENWEKVADLLDKVDTQTQSPVLRYIKGHACLATNRNNDSLEMFASALNDADRHTWQIWADDFASQHIKHAIVLYLKGDALARQKEWEAADQCFIKALELDPQCYLALNARGIVAHAVGNTLMARTYFLHATEIKENFADAHASRGTLNIYSGSVKKRKGIGPEKSFMKAKQYSRDKDPLLPLLGLGCVHYGKQEYQEARQYFDDVPEASDLAPLAHSNVLAAELGNLLRTILEAEKVGTFVQSKEYQLEGGRRVEIQESEQGLSMNFSDNKEWGVKGVDIHIPPFITIHWGPKSPKPPDDEDKGKDGGEDEGENKNENKSSIPLLYDDWLKGGIRTTNINEVAALTDAVAAVTEKVNQQIAVATASRVLVSESLAGQKEGQFGGVDADVRGARSNRGQWAVSTVYGLLYPVPRKSPQP